MVFATTATKATSVSPLPAFGEGRKVTRVGPLLQLTSSHVDGFGR